jgi:hypothetical protein
LGYHSGFFRKRNELVRQYDALGGVSPPDQCLRPANLKSFGIYYWLVLKFQFILLERTA